VFIAKSTVIYGFEHSLHGAYFYCSNSKLCGMLIWVSNFGLSNTDWWYWGRQ